MTNYKPWAIFDYDDTLGGVLIDGQIRPGYEAYNDVIRRYANEMEELGFDRQLAIDTHEMLDRKAATVHGFANKTRFASSMEDAYWKLCNESRPGSEWAGRQTWRKIISERLFNIGMCVFSDYPYVALDGALDVLRHFHLDYNIAVVTKGEESEQIRKLEESGVAPYADYIRVCGMKDDKEWEEILRYELQIGQITAQTAWAIGNSAKADVNPPLKFGLNAIHLNDPNGWTFENAEYETPWPGRKLATIADIRECIQHIPLL